MRLPHIQIFPFKFFHYSRERSLPPKDFALSSIYCPGIRQARRWGGDDRTISILVFISVLNLTIIQIYIRIFTPASRKRGSKSMQQSFRCSVSRSPPVPGSFRSDNCVLLRFSAFPLLHSCIYSHFAAFFMQMRIKLHGRQVWKAPKAPPVALYAFLWHVTQLLALTCCKGAEDQGGKGPGRDSPQSGSNGLQLACKCTTSIKILLHAMLQTGAPTCQGNKSSRVYR